MQTINYVIFLNYTHYSLSQNMIQTMNIPNISFSAPKIIWQSDEALNKILTLISNYFPSVAFFVFTFIFRAVETIQDKVRDLEVESKKEVKFGQLMIDT